LYRQKDGVEISHGRAEGVFLKLSLGALLGLLLLVAVIWAGHGAYVRWQEKRLVQKGASALERGDVTTASLSARTVLQIKPDSLPAARIAAEISERSADQSAMMWRRKIVQTKGHTAEDVLALARCALQFNDLPTAKRALGDVPPESRNIGGYHAVAAMAAQAEKDPDKATAEWEAAVRFSPQEKTYQLQLGAAKLRSKDQAEYEAGVKILTNLRSDPKFRAPATRVMITEAIARKESVGKIKSLARELHEYPETTFGDRLLLADVMRQSNDPQCPAYLSDLEKIAIAKTQDLAALILWMSQANLNVLALDFLRTLEPEVLRAWPIPMGVADIYVKLNDWAKLETAVKSADWRGFDYLRHAYLARAYRAQDKAVLAEREWSAAVKGSTVGAEPTLLLLRTAAGWNWKDEEIDLLWALTKYPEREKEALQTLYSYYGKNRDTQGLYKVLVRLAEDNSENLDIRNNLTQISLLVGVNSDEARRSAADIYHKVPNNSAYASTYAFSLLTKGDAKGAVKVMSSLTEGQLKEPSVSAYYGLCLAALNDPRAREFLDAGDTDRLLPEEKSLVEKARASLR